MPRRPPRKSAEIVDLSQVRKRLRLVSYQDRIARGLEANRDALSHLFNTGALFSTEGTRAGRDLLLAHQHLLKVVSLINALSDRGEVPAPNRDEDIERHYEQLDVLLARTHALTHRTGEYLARLKGDSPR